MHARLSLLTTAALAAALCACPSPVEGPDAGATAQGDTGTPPQGDGGGLPQGDGGDLPQATAGPSPAT
jgi:hypothetical protein